MIQRPRNRFCMCSGQVSCCKHIFCIGHSMVSAQSLYSSSAEEYVRIPHLYNIRTKTILVWFHDRMHLVISSCVRITINSEPLHHGISEGLQFFILYLLKHDLFFPSFRTDFFPKEELVLDLRSFKTAFQSVYR